MKSELARVLALQPYWTPTNTPEMEERGKLVRSAIPQRLREIVERRGPRWSVEGRDGTGLKSEIPWVRVFDKDKSPSATGGWYLVYLFEAAGETAWLSLNQGTTTWRNGEFQPRPFVELVERVTWARRRLGASIPYQTTLDIQLGASRTLLGKQYEAGNVAAIRYSMDALPSDMELSRDLELMMDLLARVYDASDRDPLEPGELSPDVGASLAILESAARPLHHSNIRVSAEERRLIEYRAVAVTSDFLMASGYRVRDVGATESYDLHATRDRKALRVEVKGTVGSGDQVILTRNEVALHRRYFPDTMLAVVSRISLKGAPMEATGGSLRTIHPWQPELELLSPLAYNYEVPILE